MFTILDQLIFSKINKVLLRQESKVLDLLNLEPAIVSKKLIKFECKSTESKPTVSDKNNSFSQK